MFRNRFLSECLVVAVVVTVGCARSVSKPEPDAAPQSGKPLALLGGKALFWSEARPLLLEAAGGVMLAELILDEEIGRELNRKHLAVTGAMLEDEERRLAEALDPDPHQAELLTAELRQRRGLGPQRYARLLVRNAGLRLLVQDQVQVSDIAIQEEYELEYGPMYEIRIIVVDSLTQASDVLYQLEAGESFVDLALKLSNDPSRIHGGLLPPISPIDATYPLAIRAAMVKLEPGQVGDPITLESGFALMQLERKIDRKSVELDDVKELLAGRVRRRYEQMLMQQKARAMLEGADITILDRSLAQSWSEQKKRLFSEP